MRTRDTDKEKLVIEKAIELIVTDGFEGFSMNKLARLCKISVATLYIYYQHKDDLIKKIGIEIGTAFFSHTMKDFSPTMPFDDGLRKQWENRMSFSINNPQIVACFEIIRHSPHGEYILDNTVSRFKESMNQFFNNAVANKQLRPLPIEVFWSVAYGPLYSLLRFHGEGKSMGGKPFTLTDDYMSQALEMVLKALKP